ncbi:hypothetical protein ABKV19_018664 [Rosa sericea]
MENGLLQRIIQICYFVLSKSELVYIIMFCRRIWQAQNEEIFQSKYLPATVLFSQIQASVAEWISTHTPAPHHSNSVAIPNRWVKPDLPFLKLNVDAALGELHGVRGMGAVLRNERGDLMIAVSKGFRGRFGVKAAETYAAALGLQMLYQSGFHTSHLILESDALSIINDLGKATEDWSLEGMLIEEVKNLFHLFSTVLCNYCPRKCIQAAHALAINALLFPAFQIWVEEGPHWLSDVLQNDVSI